MWLLIACREPIYAEEEEIERMSKRKYNEKTNTYSTHVGGIVCDRATEAGRGGEIKDDCRATDNTNNNDYLGGEIINFGRQTKQAAYDTQRTADHGEPRHEHAETNFDGEGPFPSHFYFHYFMSASALRRIIPPSSLMQPPFNS
eukprot:gene6796-4876_t